MPLENEPLIDGLIRLMHDMNGFLITLRTDCVNHGRSLDDYREEYIFNATTLQDKYNELWTNIRSVAESRPEDSTAHVSFGDAEPPVRECVDYIDNSDDDDELNEQEECDEEPPLAPYIIRPDDRNNNDDVEPVIRLPHLPPVTGHWENTPDGGYTFIPDTHISDP